jgi:two-component system, OmpR family, sensor histidine kinase MprB
VISWRRLSLRGRLTVLVTAAVAIAVVGVAVTSWLLVRGRLYQQFDAQLRSYAQLAAQSPTPAAALAALRSADRQGAAIGGERGPALTVQFIDGSGVSTASDIAAVSQVPVSDRAREVAAGRLDIASEVVTIGQDRYRVWTVRRAGGAAQVARNAEGIENTLAELALWHAVVGLVGVAGAAVAGLLVARSALRPVHALTAGAERIARTRDPSDGIEVGGRGEIARLAEAFNTMLAALADAQAAQRHLLQDAGHELRTPLTSLRNNVELLLRAETLGDPAKVLAAADRARLLTDLSAQTEELTTLVGELVDLAKRDASPEPVRPLDLVEVVGSAVDRVRRRATLIRFEVRLEPASLLGHPGSLERAVLNLLDNAVKWSPAGGTVLVSVRTDPPVVRICVADEGPGIDDADLPHVFKRFYRADAARARPGSGLGLAIVEQVATAHGGTVHAARPDTGGTLLTITLPLTEVS